MIIKNADPKDKDIATLQDLLKHLSTKTDTRKKIEQEIKNIQAGARGEAEAAYEMKFHFGERKNLVIIHDLRIEHGGLVAQIDHLIINRFLDVWVCESKHFSEGVSINEQGEWVRFNYGKPSGIPSPIAQNEKHILILQRMFRDGVVELPTRLGLTIKPDFKSVILVSNKARVTRPKKVFDGLDSVIKCDQLAGVVNRDVEGTGAAFIALSKVIGQDTLEQLGRQIARQHRPLVFNWAAKFCLSENTVEEKIARNPEQDAISPKATWAAKKEESRAENSTHNGVVGGDALTDAQPKQKLICHKCQSAVPYNVAKFCWFNKPKFGGNVFCMACQKTV